MPWIDSSAIGQIASQFCTNQECSQRLHKNTITIENVHVHDDGDVRLYDWIGSLGIALALMMLCKFSTMSKNGFECWNHSSRYFRFNPSLTNYISSSITKHLSYQESVSVCLCLQVALLYSFFMFQFRKSATTMNRRRCDSRDFAVPVF